MDVRDRIRWGMRRLLRRPDPVILMYHRVAHATIDPWGLAVDPERFEAQMAILAESRHPVPLDWLVAEIAEGRRPRGAVAVTFDDGYRDVLDNAAPILARHGVPATLFVVSRMIGAQHGYWWDELAELVLGAPSLPERLSLSFVTREIDLALGRNDRNALHLALWQAVRGRSFAARHAAVAEIAEEFGLPVPTAAPVMSEAELHRLTADGLVTLGVHCATHPSLPSLSEAEQEAEMAECKAVMERLTGLPNRRLAYPFGDFDARSERIARALGFDYAVSVNSGPANRARDRFRLPRNDVKNWDAAEFRRALEWFG